MGFFESDIVQEEAKKLFTDYQELMKLGSDYGKFDREGKKMFIKSYDNKNLQDSQELIYLGPQIVCPFVFKKLWCVFNRDWMFIRYFYFLCELQCEADVFL